MVMSVAIIRWTPQTVRALYQRYMTIINGTAPKAVLDAFAKYKIITQVVSPSNRFTVMVGEVEEKDMAKVLPLSAYFQDVCTEEEYLVVSMEDWLKALEAVPFEKIPKPEPWTK